jgi:hypothetical protein
MVIALTPVGCQNAVAGKQLRGPLLALDIELMHSLPQSGMMLRIGGNHPPQDVNHAFDVVEATVMIPETLSHGFSPCDPVRASTPSHKGDGQAIRMGDCDQIAGDNAPDVAPNRVREELGSGSAALDEAAGVAQATRLRRRSSHIRKMALPGRKSTSGPEGLTPV